MLGYFKDHRDLVLRIRLVQKTIKKVHLLIKSRLIFYSKDIRVCKSSRWIQRRQKMHLLFQASIKKWRKKFKRNKSLDWIEWIWTRSFWRLLKSRKICTQITMMRKCKNGYQRDQKVLFCNLLMIICMC